MRVREIQGELRQWERSEGSNEDTVRGARVRTGDDDTERRGE